MCYQATFAIITAALISGAIVERMRFSAFVAFIPLWSLIVYCPIAHWVWGGGWLAQMGALDFAGGMVVHVNASTAGGIRALRRVSRTGTETLPNSPGAVAPPGVVLTVTALWRPPFVRSAPCPSNGMTGRVCATSSGPGDALLAAQNRASQQGRQGHGVLVFLL
jgi:hypothetical protein